MPKDYTPFVYLREVRGGGMHEHGLSADEELERLIAEVERNGFGADLVIADDIPDEPDYVLVDSLLTVVDRKMAHARCKAIQESLAKDGYPMTRANMLAVVLYTGCDCTYAMSAAERDGDYDTWPWFSWLLGTALGKLVTGRHDDAPQFTVHSGRRYHKMC